MATAKVIEGFESVTPSRSAAQTSGGDDYDRGRSIIAAPLPRRTFLAARQRHLNRRLAPGPP
jgi:hypothetical protein